jgi:hypothetical protein
VYEKVGGSTLPSEGSLTIWSWNGKNTTLEEETKWGSSSDCVYVADVDGDGVNEVLTFGTLRNSTGRYSSLRAWHYLNGELILEAHYEGVSADSIFASDVDKDDRIEIITVGVSDGDEQGNSQLFFWHLEQNIFVLENTLDLDAANVTSATSVYACDLDNDGQVEIITGGYSGNLNNSKGQLSIWNWNGEELSLKADKKWQTVAGYAQNIAGGVLGNTFVHNIKVGDVDGDGTPEIVTGGFSYDGTGVNSQVKVWNLDGNVLALESLAEWKADSITIVYCVSLDDVNNDSKVEIVTGGMTAPYGGWNNTEANPSLAQLRVLGWNGTDRLAVEQSQDWTIDEGVNVWNVATGDLDNDGTVEILTAGCESFNRLCDPDMRIWSIDTASASTIFPVFEIAIAIIIGVAVISVTLFLLNQRKK